MDTDAQSKEPEGTDTEHGATDLSTAEDAQHSESQPGGPVPVSPEQVHMSLGDDVGANPQFSEAEPNPAFTEATAPPPRQATGGGSRQCKGAGAGAIANRRNRSAAPRNQPCFL